MLSKEMTQALNNQIEVEAGSANQYLAMASWCDTNGLPGSASFLYAHAEEERTHMIRLFHYVNDAGGHAHAPATKKPATGFKNIVEIFEKVRDNEVEITGSINDLVELALKIKDFSTYNFLQWYVAEQHEEEKLFNSILDKIKNIGLEGSGKYWIDNELGKMKGLKG